MFHSSKRVFCVVMLLGVASTVELHDFAPKRPSSYFVAIRTKHPMNLESTSERSSLEELAGTLRMCRRSGSPLLKAGRRRREHRAPVEWFLL